MSHKKYTLSKAFKDLGKIDKKHESGKFTKRQHDSKTKVVLKRLVKNYDD